MVSGVLIASQKVSHSTTRTDTYTTDFTSQLIKQEQLHIQPDI